VGGLEVAGEKGETHERVSILGSVEGIHLRGGHRLWLKCRVNCGKLGRNRFLSIRSRSRSPESGRGIEDVTGTVFRYDHIHDLSKMDTSQGVVTMWRPG